MNWDNIEFKGYKRYLSNMYQTEIVFDASEEVKKEFPNIDFDGQVYQSSEHIYQMLKSLDPRWKQIIQEIEDPHKTKTAAKKELSSSGDLFGSKIVIDKDFHEKKIEYMFLIVFLKFLQNKDIRKKLVETREEHLEERNDWRDVFWGTYNGVGKNYLGRILMHVRDIFNGPDDYERIIDQFIKKLAIVRSWE